MSTPLRAVFLDIGGTVMQPNPSWEHIYEIALREHGIQVPMERLYAALRHAYRHGGWGMDGGFDPTEETSFQRTIQLDQIALARLEIHDLPETFYRRLSELFMVTSHWHVFPDTHPTLEGLERRGLIIGAISNWVWSLPELLHALDLVRHFDVIAASARIGYEKPHPRIFEWALEHAGVAPSEAIHVGDHPVADARGALDAGMDAVYINRTDETRPDDLPAGIPLIRSLEELLPILDERQGSAERAAS